jgi:hypothetical protein
MGTVVTRILLVEEDLGMEDNVGAARLRRDLARYRALLTVCADEVGKRVLTAAIIETEMRLGAAARDSSGAHAPRERKTHRQHSH